MIDYRKKLGAAVDRHKKATGRSVKYISSLAANDGKFLDGVLRGEKTCTVDRYNSVMKWLEDNTPSDN